MGPVYDRGVFSGGHVFLWTFLPLLHHTQLSLNRPQPHALPQYGGGRHAEKADLGPHTSIHIRTHHRRDVGVGVGAVANTQPHRRREGL
jgi:hypothetical protein